MAAEISLCWLCLVPFQLSRLSVAITMLLCNKSPLSPYSINVAATGSGKESTRDWIREVAYSIDAGLINCVRDSVSSSTAILRHLESDKTLLLMQDEFGRQLQQSQGKEGSHAYGCYH